MIRPVISLAIGHTPGTEALFHDRAYAIADFPVITRAFAPMVREQRFDVSEIAIATFLQARAAGSDLVLLPIVLSARYQESALLRRAGDAFGPDGLRGKRIGVRAYSQTTGLWLRGVLQHDHGLDPRDVRWVTFEDAHVAGYRDPAWAERAPPGSDMLAMLRDGRLDAAIFGNETPAGPDLETVFADPAGAGAAFQARHGFMPINHMLCARATVSAAERCAVMGGITTPHAGGREAIDPALRVAALYAWEQGLTAQRLAPEQIWTA